MADLPTSFHLTVVTRERKILETDAVELVLPASRRVMLDRVGQLLGSRECRLATEAEMDRYFTDCETGAIPALRHWKGVDVIMDGHLRVEGDIYILGGTHRDALRVPFDEWFAMVNPRVELLSEPDQGR